MTARIDRASTPPSSPDDRSALADAPVERRVARPPLALTTLAALGVVFGDLGTSPLYALRDSFVGVHAVAVTHANVLGVLSLFVWSLVLVVSIKYLVVIMRADNRGEGGILALLALSGALRSPARAPPRQQRRRSLLIGLGIAGAALLYGDGVITPAISVLSAVEGLTVATSRFEPIVVPLTIGILVGLFALQPRGSGRIGRLFGPVLTLWFLSIGAIGVAAIVRHPAVLAAIDPRWGWRFFELHGWHGVPVLGTVVLCLTGAEALYADMGHFGRRPIRVAWFSLVFPSLVSSYLGMGATVLRDPSAADNPFFRAAPAWLLYPLVALATVATIIASQALITAVFSLTWQAAQLGLSPRVEVVHTSPRARGQIYLPGLNWILMAVCVATVVGFHTSTALAAAYGLAVSGTMAITTILFAVVARRRWRWRIAAIASVAGGFLLIDLAFLSANLLKVGEGGWLPLLIGGVVHLLLSTWWRGRQLLHRDTARFAGTGDDTIRILQSILDDVAEGSASRVPGTAVYLHGDRRGLPRSFLHNLRHNKVVHQRVVFLTVVTEEFPRVSEARRLEVQPLVDGVWRVIIRHGYREEPDVPAHLAGGDALGLPFRPAETTYLMGRETIVAAPRPAMRRWRLRLFGFMTRNALAASAFFRLPPNRVVELGAQVEL